MSLRPSYHVKEKESFSKEIIKISMKISNSYYIIIHNFPPSFQKKFLLVLLLISISLIRFLLDIFNPKYEIYHSIIQSKILYI